MATNDFEHAKYADSITSDCCYQVDDEDDWTAETVWSHISQNVILIMLTSEKGKSNMN